MASPNRQFSIIKWGVGLSFLFVAIVKIRGDIRPYLLKKCLRFNIIPIIEHIAMCLMETSFTLRSRGCSSPPEFIGEFIFYNHTLSFLPKKLPIYTAPVAACIFCQAASWSQACGSILFWPQLLIHFHHELCHIPYR